MGIDQVFTILCFDFDRNALIFSFQGNDTSHIGKACELIKEKLKSMNERDYLNEDQVMCTKKVQQDIEKRSKEIEQAKELALKQFESDRANWKEKHEQELEIKKDLERLKNEQDKKKMQEKEQGGQKDMEVDRRGLNLMKKVSGADLEESKKLK